MKSLKKYEKYLQHSAPLLAVAYPIYRHGCSGYVEFRKGRPLADYKNGGWHFGQ